MRSETDVFAELAALCQSEGYVHALAFLCFRDTTVLTTGTVGLYQVTIRIPSATPPGPVSVQASSGGVRTVDGVLIFAR
jgi:hypothetical protein